MPLKKILSIAACCLFCSLKSLAITYTSIPEGAIINLFDAFGKDSSLIKEWGFSCITKYHGKTILFDAGSNADIFKANVTRLGIDLKQIDIVVISHAHFDHLNGIDYLLTINPKVKIYLPDDMYDGAPITSNFTGTEPAVADSLPLYQRYFDGGATKFKIIQSGRFWNADAEFVESSREILPGVNLITTKSAFMGYFNCYPKNDSNGENACRQNGLPEVSLSLKTDKGEVLIVGCSHSGVENIVAETKKVVKNDIRLVCGGFHMGAFNRQQTNAIIDKLQYDYKVQQVAPAHCTGHLAFKLLQDRFKDNYLFLGLGSTLTY